MVGQPPQETTKDGKKRPGSGKKTRGGGDPDHGVLANPTGVLPDSTILEMQSAISLKDQSTMCRFNTTSCQHLHVNSNRRHGENQRPSLRSSNGWNTVMTSFGFHATIQIHT